MKKKRNRSVIYLFMKRLNAFNYFEKGIQSDGYKKFCLIIFLLLFIPSCENTTDQSTFVSTKSFECGSEGDFLEFSPEVFFFENGPLHSILHITHDEFLFSVENARAYEIEGFIFAGVVPHHTTAATMISGFFSSAAEFTYDTVIIIAPNHANDFANVITSYRDWDIGVFTHREFVADLLNACGFNAAISHTHIEGDHSAAVLIPYVHYYLPNAKVAPILLNASTRFDEIVNLFNWMENWINESGENVLLVASIDFSHFLTPPEAAEKDRQTTEAIIANDFHRIYSMCNNYLDSPAALIVFLKYLNALGIAPSIIDHTDATEFLGWLNETTSYKIIIG
ncbi:MAG: AmmeMemoRadiSam system protein B [Defluviitaleaceae bacterium]|nr:AmmeMemoRadiSam system protein B [Defluviitaleaceae bacterium]